MGLECVAYHIKDKLAESTSLTPVTITELINMHKKYLKTIIVNDVGQILRVRECGRS